MYYLLVALFAFVSALCAIAQTQTTLSYDPTYDNADLSLDKVACSNGPNGLESKNYTTLGSLPNFPKVGGVYTVEGYNSPQCGACYAVTYGNTNTTINILAVDASKTGFVVSETAMNALTGGNAVEFGRVDVSFVQANASDCGMH